MHHDCCDCYFDFVSFFFSGSETALTANRTKFQTEAKNGDRKAQGLTRLLDKPSEFITTILLVIM